MVNLFEKPFVFDWAEVYVYLSVTLVQQERETVQVAEPIDLTWSTK